MSEQMDFDEAIEWCVDRGAAIELSRKKGEVAGFFRIKLPSGETYGNVYHPDSFVDDLFPYTVECFDESLGTGDSRETFMRRHPDFGG